jgi:hypothetical protein
MAAALAYRWDGKRSRLYFQAREGSYNQESLIEYLRELRRHFPGQQVILLWDGLPSHRSRLMQEFLSQQAGWLGVNGHFKVRSFGQLKVRTLLGG